MRIMPANRPARPRRLLRVVAVLTAFGAVAAACGDDDTDEGATDTTAAPATTVAADGSTTTEVAPAEEPEAGGTVTVYIGRQYGIEPVFESFTEATGIDSPQPSPRSCGARTTCGSR